MPRYSGKSRPKTRTERGRIARATREKAARPSKRSKRAKAALREKAALQPPHSSKYDFIADLPKEPS